MMLCIVVFGIYGLAILPWLVAGYFMLKTEEVYDEHEIFSEALRILERDHEWIEPETKNPP